MALSNKRNVKTTTCVFALVDSVVKIHAKIVKPTSGSFLSKIVKTANVLEGEIKSNIHIYQNDLISVSKKTIHGILKKKKLVLETNVQTKRVRWNDINSPSPSTKNNKTNTFSTPPNQAIIRRTKAPRTITKHTKMRLQKINKKYINQMGSCSLSKKSSNDTLGDRNRKNAMGFNLKLSPIDFSVMKNE